jgi:hypothetical protein
MKGGTYLTESCMSNSGPPPSPPSPDRSADDTLAALHGLGSAEESEHEEGEQEEELQLHESEDREDAGVSSAASGFVGMLAKQGAPDAAALTPHSSPARPNRDEIQMAREIPLAEQDEARRAFPPAGTAPRGKKPVQAVPGWYHGAVPVMFTLGALLLLIGVWAVGGLVYMGMQKPTEAQPGYLWIHTEPDAETDEPVYTAGSKMMATAMVVCVPVAIAMGIMGGMMQKKVSEERRRSEK